MSEHIVTENITQIGTHICGYLVCSCGLSASLTHNKRTSMTIARARLKKFHDMPTLAKEKTVKGSVLRKEKKYKKQKLAIDSDFNEYGDDNFATPSPDPDIQDEQKGEVDND